MEQYIAELHRLVETCEYGDLKKDLLRDRIVVGILDRTLSAKLQMDPKLTLDAAMKQVRQSEAVHEHQLKGHSRSEPIVLEEINRGKANQGEATGGKGDHNGYTPKPLRRPPPPHNKDKCGKKCKCCGKSCHQLGTQCPAKKTMCYR